MQKSGSSSRVRVLTRVRPLNEAEIEAGDVKAVCVATNQQTVEAGVGDVYSIPVKFKFDASFDEDASQADVYNEAGAPLVDAVCQGYNAALIAYGQTGSGKTYSMLAGAEDIWALASRLARSNDFLRSEDEEPLVAQALEVIGSSPWRGAIPRAIEQLFSYVHSAQTDNVRLSCSYVEIYNEQVYDLLREGPARRPSTSGNDRALDIHEDDYKGVHVSGVNEKNVESPDDVLSMLWAGALRRAVDATDMNEYSSRSHTIFQVILEQTMSAMTNGKPRRVRSKLNLVDLAGSEKWRSHQLSKFSAQRIQEMTSINKSLSNLGNCIRALETGKSHVPFRNSKLTRLLQDCLRGNAMASFLVTLSPSRDSLEESMSSLHFADRAKGVLVEPHINELNSPASSLDAAAAEIARLRTRIRDLEARAVRTDQEPCAVLGATVQAAAARLYAWDTRCRKPGATQARHTVQDDQLAQVYEKWLLDTLTQDPANSEFPGQPCLSLEQRLAMAEWAVLLQFRKISQGQQHLDLDAAAN